MHTKSTPLGVNTDAYDRQLSFCHQLQSFDDFVVQGEDVPIEMSSCLDEVVLNRVSSSSCILPWVSVPMIVLPLVAPRSTAKKYLLFSIICFLY